MGAGVVLPWVRQAEPRALEEANAGTGYPSLSLPGVM